MRPGKPFSAKLESLGSFLTKRSNGSNVSPHKGYPTPCTTLHPAPYTLHPAPYTLHPPPSTLHPAPYTLTPTPYTLRLASCTLIPTPYTLHPCPYTLHPAPYTLTPTPYAFRCFTKTTTRNGLRNFHQKPTCHDAINFKSLRGTSFITSPSGIRPKITLVVHLADWLHSHFPIKARILRIIKIGFLIKVITDETGTNSTIPLLKYTLS